MENIHTDSVLIRQSAFATMCEDARRYHGQETGGAMVGFRAPLMVYAAGAGGPNAIREAGRFSGDVQADQACLDRIRRELRVAAQWLGQWCCARPSVDRIPRRAGLTRLCPHPPRVGFLRNHTTESPYPSPPRRCKSPGAVCFCAAYRHIIMQGTYERLKIDA
jgi:hypothetical protein